jgi:hypothetical protein
MNGVDVSRVGVGDYLDVPERAAALLIAEGWAELAARTQTVQPQDPDDEEE